MNDRIILVGMLLGVVALCITLSLAALALDRAGCSARWSDFPHEWGLLSGCRVEIDGIMIPEDRVRDHVINKESN